MSDVKLFRLGNGSAEELVGKPVALEKRLQTLIEKHLETFFKVRFVESEYSTGLKHGGRIDTLGLDENGCPTIIEYKRYANANVINQGLFYLDWLMDHKAEFVMRVQKRCGAEAAESIDWSAPRLLCIAEDFTRYDVHAIQQISRNIELIRYMFFGHDLLMLELVNFVSAPSMEPADERDATAGKQYKLQEEYIQQAPQQTRDLYDSIRDYMVGLGDDVQERILKWYIAYKRIKNFATLKVQNHNIVMWLPLNPDEVSVEEGFSRDVRGIGHHGTGDLELAIGSAADFEKAKPLIQKSFEEN